MKKSSKSILKDNIMIIVLVVVYLFFMAGTKGSIFMPMNFNALITQNAYVYILACGMLMCMLTGGNIDLSCGSVVCLLGSIGAYFMVTKEMNVGVSIGLMLVIGAVYGVVLGFLIAYMNVPPWIATLAGYLAFRGLGTQVLSANSSTGSISVKPIETFLKIFSGKLFSTKLNVLNVPCLTVGIIAAVLVVLLNYTSRASRLKKGYEADSATMVLVKSVVEAAAILLVMYKLSMAGGIPTVLVWVVLVVLLYSFITEKTTIGRHFYVVGGNREAARLSGVDVFKTTTVAYLISSFCSFTAGLITMAAAGMGSMQAGMSYEMYGVAAAVIGGISTLGGSGYLVGTIAGASVWAILQNGLTMANVPVALRNIIIGIIVVVCVLLDIARRAGFKIGKKKTA